MQVQVNDQHGNPYTVESVFHDEGSGAVHVTINALDSHLLNTTR